MPKDCINYFVFKIDGEIIEEHAQGDGQFDAFMNALAKIYKSKI
jgi:D-citramalate synthase